MAHFEEPVAEEPPIVEALIKRPVRTYQQAARDYRKPSHHAIVASDPRYCKTECALRVVQYVNGYLTGVGLTSGRLVKEKKMTLQEAYKAEYDIIRRYGSRLTQNEPDL